MIDRQMKLMRGEEVKEESKEESKEKRLSLFEVANVNWDYFSEENCKKIRIQNIVTNAAQAR